MVKGRRVPSATEDKARLDANDARNKQIEKVEARMDSRDPGGRAVEKGLKRGEDGKIEQGSRQDLKTMDEESAKLQKALEEKILARAIALGENDGFKNYNKLGAEITALKAQQDTVKADIRTLSKLIAD